MRLLLVEDDDALREDLKHSLEHAGYAVDTATDGEEGEFLGSTEPYDAVVLDLGLPKLGGMDVLKQWRSNNNTVPVVILTARGAWHEKVDGFNAGADDYLSKPFHTEELLARIQAVTRRHHGLSRSVIEAGGLTLDTERQSVTDRSGNSISLTGLEYRLLHYLMMHPGHILSKNRLSEHVYDGEHEADSNTIEVYIKRLRKKFGEDLIETRRGQGYLFTDKS
ncbi:MAG: response regulator transcription factor [Gammaproteobacteria bacterium]|nr:response regulator transcription factor [Gammaproteobacteria bacterium]